MNDESREELRRSMLDSLGKSFPEIDKSIINPTSKYPYECPYKFIDVNTLTRDDEVIEEVLQSYEKEDENIIEPTPEPKIKTARDDGCKWRGIPDEFIETIFCFSKEVNKGSDIDDSDCTKGADR